MSKKDTQWSSDGSMIDDINPHTKVKHLLIEKYVDDLVYTLYASGGNRKFTLIDGFCGGGIYQDKKNHNQLWYGSPIRFIQAVRKAHERSGRTIPLDVKFIFIEKNKEHLNCLKNFAMKNAGLDILIDEEKHTFNNNIGGQRTEQCEFLLGEFEQLVDYCILQADNRRGHALFFLDPYGWSNVSMASIRKINSLKKSEIIFNFMADFIYRFAILNDGFQSFDKILESQEFFGELREKNLVKNFNKFATQAYFRNELMNLFREKGKAKKMFTFAAFSKETEIGSRVLYYLVHMSSHERALEVMKQDCWSQNNLDCQYHYDIYGYGFKTSKYYQENQLTLELDITIDNEEFCIKKLENDLNDLIVDAEDGISFKELCRKTIELNPATKDHYAQYLKMLRNEKEIEILRYNKNGILKSTSSNKIENDDVIKPIRYKQLKLF